MFDRSFLSHLELSDISSKNARKLAKIGFKTTRLSRPLFLFIGKIHRLLFNERILDQFYFHPRESKIDHGRSISNRGARERNRTEIKLSAGEGEREGGGGVGRARGKRNVRLIESFLAAEGCGNSRGSSRVCRAL